MKKNKNKKHLFLIVFGILSGILAYHTDSLKTANFTNTVKNDTINYQENQKSIPLSKHYKYKIDEEDKILYLKPNSRQTVKFKIKNVGKSSWNIDTENSVKTTINPQDTVSLEFNITAPVIPGFYNQAIKPLVADKKWTTNNQLNIGLIVDGALDESYQYEVVDQSQINLLLKGSKQVTIKVKNTGTIAWQNHGKFPLYLIADPKYSTSKFKPLNDSWISDEIIGTMQEYEVNPGQTATFVFNMTSPDYITDHELGFKLSINNIFTFKFPIILGINVLIKKVALTFDDGYGNIDAFIDLLNNENVRGTFFMLGCVAEKNPDAMRRIVNEGHMLANHSYCHPDFRTLSDDEIRWQLSHTREVMQNITGKDIYPYFRYPYGAMNARTNAVLKEEGWTFIHWTQSTGDYKRHENSAAGRQQVYYYSTLNPPNNSIVLMHIISKSSLAALPSIIKWYRDHDYSFVTVDQL